MQEKATPFQHLKPPGPGPPAPLPAPLWSSLLPGWPVPPTPPFWLRVTPLSLLLSFPCSAPTLLLPSKPPTPSQAGDLRALGMAV